MFRLTRHNLETVLRIEVPYNFEPLGRSSLDRVRVASFLNYLVLELVEGLGGDEGVLNGVCFCVDGHLAGDYLDSLSPGG